MVDTLEYLKRGGRVSKTLAFAGNVLNIKPVLSVINGEINLIGKARGSKRGNNLLVEEIDKAGGIDFSKPTFLGYTGISDALLLKYIRLANDFGKIRLTGCAIQLSVVLSAHMQARELWRLHFLKIKVK